MQICKIVYNCVLVGNSGLTVSRRNIMLCYCIPWFEKMMQARIVLIMTTVIKPVLFIMTRFQTVQPAVIQYFTIATSTSNVKGTTIPHEFLGTP